MQNTIVYWGQADKSGATKGTHTFNVDYIKWFVSNINCIPTTLQTCTSAGEIFAETQEMKDLCGKYMPFPSISLSQNKSNWCEVFNFKTKPLLIDCLNLLKKIRNDENNLTDNLDRIQLIYSYILKDIESYSSCEENLVKSQATCLYLLSENNQWKLGNDLYFYMEGNAANSNLNDGISCLKLDLKNRTHLNLGKLLDLFNIKQIKMNDLVLVDTKSSSAEQFRKKFIDSSPYLKTWLKKWSFSSDVISSIDKTIQQDLEFKESDCLQLFYRNNFIQEANVYFDTVLQQLYITRPWNSETTLMDLPNKLCQLLNIQGFEDKLRFLLNAQTEEINKHFTKLSIEIPTEKDMVSLKPLPRSGWILMNV
jgi:hypothetical protein